jgi:hypothetical protein
MTTKIPQERDFASRRREKLRDDELLHKFDRTPAEEREVTKILRAQGLIQRRRRPIVRSLIRRTVRRVRARRTAPATAARAADSGGKDPDPEPPRPRSLRSLYSLPASVVGGAL